MASGIAQSEEESAPAARQNPVLRNFFRQEYLSFHTRSGPQRFLEDYVDRRIDHFLEESRQNLFELKEAFEGCRSVRDRWRKDSVAGGQQAEHLELARFLGQVAKKAGHLRRQLSTVFPTGLRYKSDFEVSKEDFQVRLERHFDGIAGRLERLEKHLEDYLFRNSPVVSVEDLAERDILVLLFEIRQISRSAEASLRPE